MSISQLANDIRGVVMGNFLDHCRGKSVNIDPEVIEMLVKSFLGDEVDFAKYSGTTSPSVKGKKEKKKKVKIPVEFKRMPVVNSCKCMSRTYANGLGHQCTRSHMPGEEYCKTHLKTLNAECIPIWGRADEPRRKNRSDNDKECGWKEYLGDGELEDISQESVDVLPSPVPSQSSVSSGTTDEMPNEDTLEKLVVNEPSTLVVENSDEVQESSVEEMASPPVEEKENDKAVVEEVVEGDVTGEEVVDGDVEEKVNDVSADDKVSVKEPIVDEKVSDDMPEDDKQVEETKTYPRVGTIQGVSYRFIQEDDEENVTIQVVDVSMEPPVMNVGYYDGEDYVFNEEYNDTHEMNILDEEQDEIEWK